MKVQSGSHLGVYTESPYVYRKPTVVFEEALANGGLSGNVNDDNYAGNYMYMHSTDTADSFKHIVTREYLTLPRGGVR